MKTTSYNEEGLRYYDTKILAKSLIWFIRICIFLYVIDIIQAILGLNDSYLFNPHKYYNVFYALFMVSTFILYLFWIYFTQSNSRFLGVKNMLFTPGWAVGFHFIPILNLLRPYEAIVEIWQTNKNPKNWQKVKPPSIIKLWWGLCLGTPIISMLLFYFITAEILVREIVYSGIYFTAGSNFSLSWDDKILFYGPFIIMNLFYILLGFLTIKIITLIFDMQDKNSDFLLDR